MSTNIEECIQSQLIINKKIWQNLMLDSKMITYELTLKKEHSEN